MRDPVGGDQDCEAHGQGSGDLPEGVKRVIDDSDPNNWSVTMTMTSYIEDMGKAFGSDLERELGRRKAYHANLSLRV